MNSDGNNQEKLTNNAFIFTGWGRNDQQILILQRVYYKNNCFRNKNLVTGFNNIMSLRF